MPMEARRDSHPDIEVAEQIQRLERMVVRSAVVAAPRS